MPEGRSEPTVHETANYRIEPLSQRPPALPRLPVAGLPGYEGEVHAVFRAKRRPALVLSRGGDEIPASLRTGAARYQTHRALLVAPFYGADRDGRRGGWNPLFLERIRRGEYPQYLWDKLPVGAQVKESVLRLDHLQPLGGHASAYTLTDFVLDDEALDLVDEWLQWLLTGKLQSEGILSTIRDGLRAPD